VKMAAPIPAHAGTVIERLATAKAAHLMSDRIGTLISLLLASLAVCDRETITPPFDSVK
jgi:hypothetical protein